jgi:hypothetical protein
MSSVYTWRSLPHTWYPDRQFCGTRNAHTLLQLESKVRGLVHQKHWRPERQSSHTGWFLLVVAMKALYCTIGPMSDDQHKQIGIQETLKIYRS